MRNDDFCADTQAVGPPWLHKEPADRRTWTQQAVHAAVAKIVGSAVGAEEPLLRAGVDSLGEACKP